MRALSRKKAPRESLLRNLATSLVLYEKIETTEAKAKEVKPIVEHLIAEAKKNDLNARRKLLKYFFDKNATDKVFEVLVPRYKKIQSGFIKSYRKGNRQGDGAMILILELQGEDKAVAAETVKDEKLAIKEGNNGIQKEIKPSAKEGRGSKTTKSTKEK